MKIYVASSWRNTYQPGVVERLTKEGFAVYDFKNPAPGNKGFSWSEIDPEWLSWSQDKFIEALKSPVAVEGFGHDMNALRDCDVCVLVLPCNRSAHLEAGFALGMGKPTIIYLPEPSEPELMYSMSTSVVSKLDDVCSKLQAMALERKIPKMLYFGCWDQPGHYLVNVHGAHQWHEKGSPKYVLPWDRIDGALCYGCKGDYDNGPQKEGLAKLHQKNGWTALSFWDRSVDKRGGCNSNFFLPAIVSFDEMVRLAKQQFPQIWARYKFPVELTLLE